MGSLGPATGWPTAIPSLGSHEDGVTRSGTPLDGDDRHVDLSAEETKGEVDGDGDSEDTIRARIESQPITEWLKTSPRHPGPARRLHRPVDTHGRASDAIR